MSNRTAEDFALETSAFRRYVYGLVRRLTLTRASGVKWQFRGQRPKGSVNPEIGEIEPFQGIGFFARPPTDTVPESIAVSIGGPKHQVVVAMRDEETRKLVDGQVADDETCVYNSTAIIVVKANGTVEIRLHGGVAIPLATLQDLNDLKAKFQAWVVVPNDGGAALKTQLTALIGGGWPHGTSVLKAQ